MHRTATQTLVWDIKLFPTTVIEID